MTKDISDSMKITDNHIDDHVDDEIQQCFLEGNNKSFFMFAGAGSGKTRSLINTLTFLNEEKGMMLSAYSKQVAVITYTNAACDEISKRLHYKPIFIVSTIHSFLWNLIKSFQVDIKSWVIESINNDIAELKDKQAKGRGGEAALKRDEELKRKTKRLLKIKEITKFSYNPNGDNVGYDALSHSEVIKMGAEFISTQETMQEILVGKYPIILIDESQDTKKELVDALLIVYKKFKDNFTIGMFGDTMQRIYMDGKDNLESCIPVEWEKPEKIMNHRSAKRIVEIANSIRNTIDKKQQQARSDAETGTLRLFIVNNLANKEQLENQVVKIMANRTADNNWLDSSKYKSLILEHHMAASRFGFSNLYKPLNESKLFDTSLREGSIPELSLLYNVVAPLVKAYQENNDFEVSKIIRQNSPLLDKKVFREYNDEQVNLLEIAENAVEDLLSLWKDGEIPRCIDIIKKIKESNIFKLNVRVDNILSEEDEDEDKKVTALRKALSVPFDELIRYSDYVTGKTQFATHQGVKGLEFPRVMVILDDVEAKGFLFSYEKLFGAKPITDTDIKNEKEGKDTGITRTARLFYVACTRAEKSLAIVAYTENLEAVKSTAIENGWFLEDEIEVLS